MDTSHEQFMRAALEEAMLATAKGDLPFGAVVVCDGKIVGRGHALDNTTGDVTDHAEISAVREACHTLHTNKLAQCSIYCTNEPCLMCAATIFQAKISKVFIGASRDDLPFLRPRHLRIDDLAHDSSFDVQIMKGILKDQVLALFKGIKK